MGMIDNGKPALDRMTGSCHAPARTPHSRKATLV